MTLGPTIENLMRVLDENPELLAAMRARILTRELLELPATVARNGELIARNAELIAQLTEQVNRNAELIAQLVAQTARNSEKIDRNAELIAQNSEKIDRNAAAIAQNSEKIDRNAAAIAELSAEVKEFKGEFKAFVAHTDRRFAEVHDKMDKGFRDIRQDIGILKAAHARNVAEREASAITDALGLRRIRNLTYDDLRDLSLGGDTADISRNDLLSFRRADLVLEARDDAAELCYVAVEVSYTANGRDTSRAIRNAQYLTRFTGLSAHAAIAGIHQDNRIADLVAAGAVFWHQLEPEDLESD